METRPGEDQVAIRIESEELRVAPGGSLTVLILLHSLSTSDGLFELTVRGIPSNWVSVPSPVVRLAAGEQREVLMMVQPPSPPYGRAGRHRLVVRVAPQEAPQQATQTSCTLTVAALEVPGRIGILLAATEFLVAPGERLAVPLVLVNQGLEADVVRLSVAGIPTGWVYASSASTALNPGQQEEVTLTIQPPAQGSDAGPRPFQILVASQAVPGQVAAAGCTLTIAPSRRFSSELQPQRVESGAPAHLTVENQGNVEQSFHLAWQSPDDVLSFEPGSSQELRVPPGEVAMAEFRAKPRSRPLFGRERVWPFSARVQTAEGLAQDLKGEVVGKALLPSWVLPAALVALVAIVLIPILFAALDGSPEAGTPPEAPTATVPSEQPTEPPPEATEPPPEPTEPPPEPTEPPPEPTEPPPEPTEQPPEGTEPPPDPGEGGLPCIPAAVGLLFAPLLVMRVTVGGKRSVA